MSEVYQALITGYILGVLSCAVVGYIIYKHLVPDIESERQEKPLKRDKNINDFWW